MMQEAAFRPSTSLPDERLHSLWPPCEDNGGGGGGGQAFPHAVAEHQRQQHRAHTISGPLGGPNHGNRGHHGTVGIDGLAPLDDAVYTKSAPKIHAPIGVVPEQKEDKGSPPPHIDTLFRSSFHSDFNLLASPLTKPSSLFSQLSFSSDSTLPMSPPAPSSPLVHDARSTAGTAAAGGVDDVIDADDTMGLGLLVADLSLANESVNGIDHASSYYGLAVPAITHRRSSTQRSYPLGSPGTNLPTDPTPTAAGMNGLQSHPNVQLQTLPCDLRGGEHPYGEHPSRTLFVRNIHSSVDDEELRILFSSCGTDLNLQIRSMYTQCKHRGFVMISYFDIRDAKTAMQNLQNKVVRGRKLDIHYSIPKDNPSEKDQNQGTLVVFNLDPSTTDEELIEIFGQYGEIKEIRATPNKKHHKFIEFYDVRHAERAMKCLNKTEIKGKKIKIEPSRPGGGVRKNTQFAHHSHGTSPVHGLQQPQPQQLLAMGNRPPVDGELAHLAHSGNGIGESSGSPPPARARSSSLPSFPVAVSPTPPENIGEEAWIYHFSPIGSLHSMGPVRPPPVFAKRSSPPMIPPQDQQAWNGSNGNNGPAGMAAPGDVPYRDYAPRYYSAIPMYQLPQRFIPAPQSNSWRPNNTGAALPPRQPSTYMTENRVPTIVTPPMASIPMNAAPLSPHNQSSALSSASASSRSPIISGASTLSVSPTSQAGPAPQSDRLSPTSNLSPNNAMMLSRARERGTTYPPIGIKKTAPAGPQSSLSYRNAASQGETPPRKAGRARSDSADDSKSHAHKHKGGEADAAQFTLDIQKVNDGREKRTTLMIKNIPNKYSQKMLLAAVDERHRGKYDFFYLPIDFKNKCNVGYAFINFIDCLSIVPFYNEFHGKKWEKFNSEKVCAITYARIQGKNSLIAHFQNSSLMCEDRKCRPIIFHSEGPHQGEQEPFPVGNNIRMRRKDSDRGKPSKENDLKS